MKKKEIRTKVLNAINLALFESQLTPTRKITKSIKEFSREFATSIKDELKAQADQGKNPAKTPKTKKAKPVRVI